MKILNNFNTYRVEKGSRWNVPYIIHGPRKTYNLARNQKDPSILFITGPGKIRGYSWFKETPEGLLPYI